MTGTVGTGGGTTSTAATDTPLTPVALDDFEYDSEFRYWLGTNELVCRITMTGGRIGGLMG